MDAMTILRRCRGSEEEIRRLEGMIWRRRDAMTSLQSVRTDPDGGSRPTGDTDKIGRMLADVDALERRLEERRNAQAVETASSCAMLDMIPDLESRVLYDYYVRRMTTAEVARKQKYQEGYVRKVKKRGEDAARLLTPERVRSTLPRWYLEREEGEHAQTR